MDDKKALRISNREQAVELFATNPDIEAKRVAELLDVTPQVVYEFRRDPNFHMQVQDRFMAELENDIPSMVSALKREVLAGNVQATRLMFEYMNKLQKNINITIDSPFEMIVPNGAITAGTIVNVNANPTRRVDLVVGIGYEDDIKKTKDVLTNILESNDLIIQNKGLTVAVSELADSSVNFVVRAWVNTPDYWAVKFALTEQIKLRFDKEGISIPFPQQDVHHHNQA